MDEKLDDFSEALHDVLDLLEYQERVVFARDLGALAFAVDRIIKAGTKGTCRVGVSGRPA